MVSMNQCKGELAECASKYYVYLVNYSCICVGTYVNMQCVNAWLWYIFHFNSLIVEMIKLLAIMRLFHEILCIQGK